MDVSSDTEDICNPSLTLLSHGGILEGGLKISCSKNRFFELLRARCIFGARQPFEKTFDHIKKFCIWQIFLIVFSWLYSKNGLETPPIWFQDSIFMKRHLYLKIMKALNLSNSRLVKGGGGSATLGYDLTDESHMLIFMSMDIKCAE